MSGSLINICRDFINLFYPPACVTCKSILVVQEKYICTSCLYNLPETNFHLYATNSMAEEFWGRVLIENAAALYYFEKGGKCQKILHNIKYKGNRKLANHLGEIYGSKLSRSGKFLDIDIIVPVPLHPSREKSRGFNQSEWFARGLSNILKKPMITGNLVRFISTGTQTTKSRIERWDNVKDSFRVRYPEKFESNHVLLVDDVVTTGATLDACASVLKRINEVRVSILTLAFA